MNDDTIMDLEDRAHVVIRPPLLWFLVVASWGLDWLVALPFVPAPWPNIWIGSGIFAAGFLLALWAFKQFPSFREDVDTHTPSTVIIESGPFSVSRNPIYLGMLIGILGAAIAANTLWILLALVVWYPVMRWGVIAREEAYLERKFGETYLAYKRRVRRWI